MNKITLIGHVGKDPETKVLNAEAKVTNFTLATNRKEKGQKVTDWHNVQAWNKVSDVIEKYVTKGSLIAIEGSVHYRTYEKDGVKKYSTEIIAREIELLSKGTPKEEEDPFVDTSNTNEPF